MLGIHGGDAADREAVAPVRVGHAQARLHDAGQRSHVRGLHEDLVVHRLDQRGAAKDAHGHVHAGAQTRCELEERLADLSQTRHVCHGVTLALENLLTSVRVPPIHARN